MRKRILFVIVAVVAVIFSCKRVEYIDPEEVPQIIGTPLSDGVIGISVSPGGNLKAGLVSDTVNTEKWLKTTYQAIAKNGINIAAWQWTFAENNQKVTGSAVDFWHGLDPGLKTAVTLIGIESNGTAHTATVWIKIVNSLDGLPSMIIVTKTPVSGGMASYVIICHKKSMTGATGAYGYTGTISSPSWTVLPIAPADTNFNYVNGVLIAAKAGDFGKYVAIRFTTYPGDYEFHVGHIKSDGTLIWGNPWDWFIGGKYTQDSNTNLSPRAVANLPGAGGDTGSNAVVRQDIKDSTVVVYTKQTTTFSKGFVQFQNVDGTWGTPIAESTVLNFPNWGKFEIKYKEFPIKDLMVFRFGPDISAPASFSLNMPLSGYWSSLEQCLRAKYVPIGS